MAGTEGVNSLLSATHNKIKQVVDKNALEPGLKDEPVPETIPTFLSRVEVYRMVRAKVTSGFTRDAVREFLMTPLSSAASAKVRFPA